VQDRRIRKTLYEKALKEYRDKRPNSIVGFRVKKSVLLQRGYGPSILVSGLKGQIPPYLLLADYGSHLRLYYILENGIIVNAINIPKEDFTHEELKFQKATSKLFRIPKFVVPEKKLEKLKRQINAKFQTILSRIERQTSCNATKVPIITIYQDPVEAKAIIKREEYFLKFPLELINHKLRDGFIIREAFKLVLPLFTKKTAQKKILELIGTYHLLAKTLRPDWLEFWNKNPKFRETLAILTEPIFNSYLQFLRYLSNYELSFITDPFIDTIFSTFTKQSQQLQSNPEMAAYCYLNIDKIDSRSKIKAVLFFILAEQFDAAKNVLKRIPKRPESGEIQELRKLCQDLVAFRLSHLYTIDINSAIPFPTIRKLFYEARDLIQSKVLYVRRIHDPKHLINEPIIIKLKIENQSDLIIKNLEIDDIISPKLKVELMNSPKFYFTQVEPHQSISCEYTIKGFVPQSVWFKNGRLIFEDVYGHHYIEAIPTTYLQIK